MSKKELHKLLLHICCVGCGVYIAQVLKKEAYQVTLFFYNPNIWPESEHKKRLEEANRIARNLDIKIISINYTHREWLSSVKGLENEPEKGRRCLICYEDRLRKTAEVAKENNFDYFTTTLSTSPHKQSKKIIELGKKIADDYNLNFLDRDFKKQDGFKKSSEMSKKLGLYRQNYCGCEFSLRE